MRYVGEQGPELFRFTRPVRIYTRAEVEHRWPGTTGTPPPEPQD